jgi:acyl dehydratase
MTSVTGPAAELVVGSAGPTRDFGPITRTHIVRYAGASGDLNPVHHDEHLARRSGLPSVFSIGMLQAGMLATYATDWLGDDTVRRFRVRFIDRVWPGDVLRCSGVVASVQEREGARIVEVELNCHNQDQRPVLSGSAVFEIPVAFEVSA